MSPCTLWMLVPVAAAGWTPVDGLPKALAEAIALPPEARAEWAATRPGVQGVDAARVVLEVDDAAAALAAVLALDPLAVVEQVAQVEDGWRIQAWVGWEALASVATSPAVGRVREPFYASPKFGTVVTEGLGPMGVPSWHDQGITGRGVTVGIVDVGFQGLAGQEGEEIPGVELVGSGSGWGDHGVAVAEIIADVAPGAALVAYVFETDVEFLNILDTIRSEQVVDVVNASIGFDNLYPADGQHPYAQAVDALADAQGVYVAAAGNEGGKYIHGPLTDQDADGWLEVGGIEELWVATWANRADLLFRWSDASGASGNDLDVYVFRENGADCGAGEDVQDGDDYPLEFVSCDANGDWAAVGIWLATGSFQGLDGYLYSYNGVDADQATWESTLTLPADARGATAAGAYYPGSGELAWYSSQGPTEDGRIKPDVVAPSAVSTATYGPQGADGTSFAAPHVSGAAALLLDAGLRRGDDVRDYLAENAQDLGAAGPDNLYGAGAVYLDVAPEGGCGCGGGPAGGGLAAAASLALLIRRRRA